MNFEQVYYGKTLLASQIVPENGDHQIYVTSPSHPSTGHLILQATDKYGVVLQNIYTVRYGI